MMINYSEISFLQSQKNSEVAAFKELYNDLCKYYENSEFIIYGELIKRTAVEEGLYDDYLSVVDNKLGMDIASRQITQVFN